MKWRERQTERERREREVDRQSCINESIRLFYSLVCLFGWFLNVLVNYYVISRTGPKTERLTILRAATHETELGNHDFCLSRLFYSQIQTHLSRSIFSAS